MRHLSFVIPAVLLFPGSLAPAADDKLPAKSSAPVLCVGNYHSEADAVRQLERISATYSNLQQWRHRAERIRQQILTGMNLNPLPDRTPLNSIVHKKREHNGYSVESAAFEARPGFLVYGSLYRP